MLPRSLRLSRAEIEGVVARGRRFGSREFGLRILKSRYPLSRFAIVVPAKEVKLSVKRHLLKRRLRSIIRSVSSQVSTGFDIVVFCGSASARWDFPELKEKFVTLLQDSLRIK